MLSKRKSINAILILLTQLILISSKQFPYQSKSLNNTLISENKSNKEWNEDNLAEYINAQIGQKTSDIFDPDNMLESEAKKKILKISDEIATRFQVYVYAIFAVNTTKNIDLSIISASISYPSPVTYDNSFILFYSETSGISYKYHIGEGIQSKFKTSFKESLGRQYFSKSSQYLSLKKVYRLIRNNFILPQEEYYLPSKLVQAFADEYGNDINKIPYAFFDPTLEAEYDTFDLLKKFYEDLKSKGLKVYLLVLDVNKSLYNTDGYFTNFLTNFTSLYGIKNATKTIFILYYIWNNEFRYKLTTDLCELSESDKQKIENDGKIFSDDLPKTFYSIMKTFRFLVAGECLGWNTDMFIDHLLTSTQIKKDNYYVFSSNYVKITHLEASFEQLVDKGVNLYIFIIKKLDNQIYDKDFTKFHKEMMLKFDKISYVMPDRTICYYVSINDNNLTSIQLGDDHLKLMTNENMKEINDIGREKILNQSSHNNLVKYLIKTIRYYVMVENKDFTPEVFAAHFNNIYDEPHYVIYDPNNTLNGDYIEKENFTYYLDHIYSGFTSFYIISINNINKTIYPNKESTKTFMDELSTNFTKDCYTTTSKNIIVVVYFPEFKKIDYYVGRFVERLTKTNIETITKEVLSIQPFDPTLAIHCILKYINYYLYSSRYPWVGESMAKTLNDFYGKPTYFLFDPFKLFYNIKLEWFTLQAFLNEFSEKFNLHTYFFVRQTSSEGKTIDDIEKTLKLPDGMTKEDCFFIVYNSFNKSLNYKVGSKLKSYFDDSIVKSTIETECSSYLTYNHYDGMKCIFSILREYIFMNTTEIWDPSTLNDFINKYYTSNVPEILSNNFIFDYYRELTENNQNELYKTLDNLYSNRSINMFIFILNRIQQSEESKSFLEELHQIATFSNSSKSNVLYFLFELKSSTLYAYTGQNLKIIITDNKLPEIVKESEFFVKMGTNNGINYFINQIESMYKLPHHWSGEYIKDYLDNHKHGSYCNYLDPYLLLSNEDAISLFNELKSYIPKGQFYYVITLPYKDLKFDVNDYLNDISLNYPIPEDIKNQLIIYILFINTENEIYIKVVNDFEKFAKYDKIEEIRKKSKSIDNYFERLNKTVNSIYLLFPSEEEDKKPSSHVFEILSGCLGFVILVFIIIYFVCRYLRKKKKSKKGVDANEYINFNINQNNILDNVNSLNSLNSLN